MAKFETIYQKNWENEFPRLCHQTHRVIASLKVAANRGHHLRLNSNPPKRALWFCGLTILFCSNMDAESTVKIYIDFIIYFFEGHVFNEGNSLRMEGKMPV